MRYDIKTISELHQNINEHICAAHHSRRLKEIGFHMFVRNCYIDGLLITNSNSFGDYNNLRWVRTWRHSDSDDTLSAPTINQAIDWLASNYNFVIESRLHINDDMYLYYSYVNGKRISQTPYKNKIDAQIAGLDFVLKQF